MPSETIVFQSFRTSGVPAWIARCLESTRHWARLRGFDYQFIDDRFFDYVPRELRAQTSNKVVLSDLARLLVSRELLAKRYRRTVWVDADVIVFDPERWDLPTDSDFYFCHELWPSPREGGVRLDIRANNAVMIFSGGNHFLDFYIDSCARILSSGEPLKNWHLGVRFLTALRNVCPLPVLENIGMLGPDLIEDLLRGPKRLLSSYVRAMGRRQVAANLCGSMADANVNGFIVSDAVLEQLVDRLITSRGELLNAFLGPAT